MAPPQRHRPPAGGRTPHRNTEAVRVAHPDVLRARRDLAGYTQEELAFLCNRRPKQWLQKVEAGDTVTMPLREAKLVCEWLGADFEHIFEPIRPVGMSSARGSHVRDARSAS